MHGRAAERVPVSWVADCAVGARESFARITTPLARGLAVPLALVTVPGEERRLIGEAFGLSREIGAAGRSTGGEPAFAQHCIDRGEVLVVDDATVDARFCAAPLVVSAPFIRFYAGIPVHAPDGTAVAVLSAIDTRPRELTPSMRALLEDMGAAAEEILLLLMLSAQDRLTKLLGRAQFDDTLGREWRRARRDESALSLIMFDVDHFKAYNDRLGHPAGDGCLRRVADVLQENFRRPGDVVFRYGGEEFAVVLPQTPQRAAVQLARRAARAMELARIPHPGATAGHVTVSAGVAGAVPAHTPSGPGALLDAADEALYAAKAGGRNTVRQAGAADRATLAPIEG